MKIFETVKKHLASIGFEVNEKPFNVNQLRFILMNGLAIILMCIYLVFIANTEKEYMESIFIMSIGVMVTISNLSTAPKTATVFKFINREQEIIDNRLKHPKSERMYKRTNRLVEKLCKIFYVIIVKIFAPGVILPKAIYCIFIYVTTDLGSDAFDLPLPIWVPFDWKNPIGYLVAAALQLHLAAMPFRYIECFLTLGLAGLIFFFSIVKDVNYSLKSFNKMAKTSHTRSELMKSFFEIIRFIDLRVLADYIIEVYSITLTGLSANCGMAVCLSMLVLQVEFFESHNYSEMLFESMFFGVFSLSLMFVTCEIGERLTSGAFGIEEKLYQLDWYLYPIEIQRLLVPIMVYAQKPLEIVFFGSLTCSRQQFKKVVNTAYSCFMLLNKTDLL